MSQCSEQQCGKEKEWQTGWLKMRKELGEWDPHARQVEMERENGRGNGETTQYSRQHVKADLDSTCVGIGMMVLFVARFEKWPLVLYPPLQVSSTLTLINIVLYPPLQSPCVLCDSRAIYSLHSNRWPSSQFCVRVGAGKGGWKRWCEMELGQAEIEIAMFMCLFWDGVLSCHWHHHTTTITLLFVARFHSIAYLCVCTMLQVVLPYLDSLVRLVYPPEDGKMTLSLISSSTVPLCPLWLKGHL